MPATPKNLASEKRFRADRANATGSWSAADGEIRSGNTERTHSE